MFTDAQIRKLYKGVLDRMVKAKWLLSYTFTDGKGFHLNWTEHGSLTSLELKKWGINLHLLEADARPVFACELAHGVSPDRRSKATTVNTTLRPFVDYGFATHASFNTRTGCEIAWTTSGIDFCNQMRRMVAELGLPRDEDNVLALFHIAAGWAPCPDTEIRFYSDK